MRVCLVRAAICVAKNLRSVLWSDSERITQVYNAAHFMLNYTKLCNRGAEILNEPFQFFNSTTDAPFCAFIVDGFA